MVWRPRIAITIGDVAGIGPEVVARACADPRVRENCRPVAVGHPSVLRRAVALCGVNLEIVPLGSMADDPDGDAALGCFNSAGEAAADVSPSAVDPHAGRAARDYLAAAAHSAL